MRTKLPTETNTMTLTRSELTSMINLAYQATEASCVGTVYMDDDVGGQCFNNLAYNTFLSVLARIIPVQADMSCKEVKDDE